MTKHDVIAIAIFVINWLLVFLLLAIVPIERKLANLRKEYSETSERLKALMKETKNLKQEILDKLEKIQKKIEGVE